MSEITKCSECNGTNLEPDLKSVEITMKKETVYKDTLFVMRCKDCGNINVTKKDYHSIMAAVYSATEPKEYTH